MERMDPSIKEDNAILSLGSVDDCAFCSMALQILSSLVDGTTIMGMGRALNLFLILVWITSLLLLMLSLFLMVSRIALDFLAIFLDFLVSFVLVFF